MAQPVRRLPFGLRGKVDKKLNELLQEDIIEKVPSGPTEWTSPLVVVPKPDDDICICVDMRTANQAIKRERHYSYHRRSSSLMTQMAQLCSAN